ncbi:uncharacterized protein [Panulirus ornatus]|uniref:uncharacterized protein n=1 Tax=Panulirus ornatus TaxID=150431 RepID=UPI003A84B374
MGRKRLERRLIKVVVWCWCVTGVVFGTPQEGGDADGSFGDPETEEVTEVRNDPAEDTGGVPPCPASCFCEEEAGYATCVGDGQWAPPKLPPGLTRVELRGFLVPELGATQLRHLPGLRELQLNQCNLTRLYNDAFASLTDLDRLDLSENRLVVLGPDSFRGLRSLRHLDLSANQLSNLTQPFTHLPTLQHLNLRENTLTSLTQDTFQGLDRVQYVNLDANKILTVEVAAFQHLTSLAHLILSNNPLSSLATLDFFGSRLQYIDVSNIGIGRVPQALTQFVRDLRLAKNSIREIHRGDLDSYPYLGLLVLDDNGLEILEEDALGRHEYLARLWLNGNSLTNIPLSLPPALRALYIEENQIDALRDGDFRVQSNLEQMFLQRNHIATIAPCALCELTSLKTLDLQANRLNNLTGRVFARLSSLETLDLSQNPILTLDADIMTGLTSVRVLQMSRIHSTSVEIPANFFDPLKGLQILEMYGSPQLVARLVNTTRMLHSLRGIRELNIMHNDLTSLRTDFPAFFPKLQVAKLSGNTWDCSRPGKVMWLKRWMTHSPVNFYRSYSVRCTTPESFGYKPIMLLEGSDFTASTMSLPPTTTTPSAAATTYATTAPPAVAVVVASEEEGEVEMGGEGNGTDSWGNVTGTDVPPGATSPPPGTGSRDLARGDRNSSHVGIVPLRPTGGPASTTVSRGAPGDGAATPAASVTPENLRDLVGPDRPTEATTPTTVTSATQASSPRPLVTTQTTTTSHAAQNLSTSTSVKPPTSATSLTPSPPPPPPPPSSTTPTDPPYWVVHNRMPPRNATQSPVPTTGSLSPAAATEPQPLPGERDKEREETKRKKILEKPRKIRVNTPDAAPTSLNTRGRDKSPSLHRPQKMDHNKDLWIYRGDSHHGLSPGQPLPMGLGHGRVSDGAVVGAGIVASCVGVALLVGGYLLARGRSKAGPIWETSTYWRDGSDEDVVMAVGVGTTGTGLMTESEGTVGVVTETHRGLNNRLYLLLQRDSTTGITPDTLPDPRSHSPAPDWH